jgi:hypothetical protein
LIAVKDSSAECGDDGAVEASGERNPNAFVRREEACQNGFGKDVADITITIRSG